MGFSIYQYGHKPSESIKSQLKMKINSKDENLPKHELESRLIKLEIHNPNSRIESNLHDHAQSSYKSPFE